LSIWNSDDNNLTRGADFVKRALAHPSRWGRRRRASGRNSSSPPDPTELVIQQPVYGTGNWFGGPDLHRVGGYNW